MKEIFANYLSDRSFTYKIYKKLCFINNNQQPNLKMTEGFEKTFL